MVLGHKHATKPAACGRQYTPQECSQGTQQAQQQAIQGLAPNALDAVPIAPVIPDDRPACTDTNMVDWIDREALCLYLHNLRRLGNPSEAPPSSLTMYGTNSCLNWKTLALYYESMHGKQCDFLHLRHPSPPFATFRHDLRRLGIPPKVLLNGLELSSPSVANLSAPVHGCTHVKQCDCPHLRHLRHDLHLGIPPKVLLNGLELSSPSVAILLAPVHGCTHVKQCDCPHLLHLRHDLCHLGIPPKVLLNGWESSSPSAANLSAPGTNNTITSFDNLQVTTDESTSVPPPLVVDLWWHPSQPSAAPFVALVAQRIHKLEFNELLAAIFSTRNIAANNLLKAKYPGGNVGRVPQRWWEVGLNIMWHHLSITCTTSEEAAKVIAEVAKVVAEVAKVITEVAKVVAEVAKVFVEVAKVFMEVVKVFVEVAEVAEVTQRLRRLFHTDQFFQKTIKLNP
ncbi:hypothetical protein B0H13DRAFT_2276612 [Mycena leptocephala]|nr:hypothetical protein B0H13DRAFT_2276612 [Mycena leptocephala]